jgi:erythritol kinase
MDPVLICLDSGTTAVKAAAFDRRGRLLASAERGNSALRRNGIRVEQDMAASRDDALAVLRDCAAQVPGRATGCVLTGQGDGLWPVDAAGEPVGAAMTWLDGRARDMAAGIAPALDAVQDLTGARPTAAAASLQLLWLQHHDPARFARLALALRLKEWLFLSLTGRVMAEPTSALPVWGSWRSGQVLADVPRALGLARGLEVLPEFRPMAECQAGLSPHAAAATGLPAGLPVLLGPGDVQATLLGLGLGRDPEVTGASIFGTSAIHACLTDDPDAMPAPPPGAMVLRLAMGAGYICLHPGFNGASLLHHLARQFADLPTPAKPAWSGLVLHPFLEPGGERAPWTNPHAQGALFGLTAATTPAEIAWAGREALAFVARKSHEMMGGSRGTLALGGGLAADPDFGAFLATALGRPVRPSPGGQAGLRGLATLGAKILLGDDSISYTDETDLSLITPQSGAISAYANMKYNLFVQLVAAVAPVWDRLSDLRTNAESLKEPEP